MGLAAPTKTKKSDTPARPGRLAKPARAAAQQSHELGLIGGLWKRARPMQCEIGAQCDGTRVTEFLLEVDVQVGSSWAV